MATTDENIFHKVLGMLCELCGAHKAVSPFELYERMKRGPIHCDCGANAPFVLDRGAVARPSYSRYSSGYPTEISPTPADLSVGATVSGAASQVMAVPVPADETQPFGSSLLRAHKGRQ